MIAKINRIRSTDKTSNDPLKTHIMNGKLITLKNGKHTTIETTNGLLKSSLN